MRRYYGLLLAVGILAIGWFIGTQTGCNIGEGPQQTNIEQTVQEIPDSLCAALEAAENDLLDKQNQITEITKHRDSLVTLTIEDQKKYQTQRRQLELDGLVQKGIEHFYMATVEVARTTISADSLTIDPGKSGVMRFQIPIAKEFYDVSNDGMILEAGTPLTESLKMQGDLVGWTVRLLRREVVVPKGVTTQ